MRSIIPIRPAFQINDRREFGLMLRRHADRDWTEDAKSAVPAWTHIDLKSLTMFGRRSPRGQAKTIQSVPTIRTCKSRSINLVNQGRSRAAAISFGS